MNYWIEKSIKLANNPGYLDKLYKIYPMDIGTIRTLPTSVLENLEEAIKAKDKLELVKISLKNLELFPIKDSYIAFLRRNPSALIMNPVTIERIGSRLLSMGYREIIKASTQPKETNRQIGPLFHRWIVTLGYPILPEEKFINHKGIAFLAGSDTFLKDFSNRILHTNLKKGLDLLVKVGNTFVLGEAKFLTDFGGHQNAQFNDALTLLHTKVVNNIVKIAVLDGVLWIKGNNKMFNIIKKEKEIVLSALLLQELISKI